MAKDLPKYINYWITSTSKHDCFFNVGQEPGPIERIGAIKVILIGHSEVFRKMLDESDLAETGDISITDSDPETFKNFLKCIYGGTQIVLLELTFEQCIKIVYLCDKYLVSEVKEEVSRCIIDLHQPLTTQNVLIVLSNPASLNDKGLENEVLKFIQNNTEIILNDKLFLNLDTNALTFVAKQNSISTEEVNLWKALLNWAKQKVERDDSENDLRSCLKPVLKYIRFCTMKSEEFCIHVVPSKVLTPEEVFEICTSLGTNTAPNMKDLSNSVVRRFKKPTTEVVLYYVLHNIDEFRGSKMSEKIACGDFKWSIKLTKSKDEKSLGFYLSCEPLQYTPDWKCCASAKLTLISRYREKNWTMSYYSHLFDQKGNDWGYSPFISWEDLLIPKNGYVKSKTIEVTVEVNVEV